MIMVDRAEPERGEGSARRCRRAAYSVVALVLVRLYMRWHRITNVPARVVRVRAGRAVPRAPVARARMCACACVGVTTRTPTLPG